MIRLDRDGAFVKWLPGEKQVAPEALVRVDREGRMVKALGRKYSPDQPRVPAGSPEGGQWVSREIEGGTAWHWTGPGEPVGSPFDPTAKIGGMELAKEHEQTMYRLAGNTDAYRDEHAVTIGPDGKASKMIRGNGSSVRIPDASIGAQGTIHTHPARKDQKEPSCFSPGDIESHMIHAWKSENENYTSIVVSLSTGDARVKVYTLKGWPKGGPRKVQDEMYDFIRAHTQSRLFDRIDDDEWVRQVNSVIKTYTTTVLGLEWEEAWFG